MEIFVVTDGDVEVQEIPLSNWITSVEGQGWAQDEIVLWVGFGEVDVVVPIEAERRSDEEAEITAFEGVWLRFEGEDALLCGGLDGDGVAQGVLGGSEAGAED